MAKRKGKSTLAGADVERKISRGSHGTEPIVSLHSKKNNSEMYRK